MTPGLHAERLERIARIIQSIRDVYLSGVIDTRSARGACTAALEELKWIIQEMKDQ